jgi:hypothetical protein
VQHKKTTPSAAAFLRTLLTPEDKASTVTSNDRSVKVFAHVLPVSMSRDRFWMC